MLRKVCNFLTSVGSLLRPTSTGAERAIRDEHVLPFSVSIVSLSTVGLDVDTSVVVAGGKT